MKKYLLFLLLAMSLPLFAQTTYRLQRATSTGRDYGTSKFYAFGDIFDQGLTLGDTQVSTYNSCANEPLPHYGFTHYTLNGAASDCLAVTDAPTFGPTISVPTGRQFNPQLTALVHRRFTLISSEDTSTST